MSPPPSLVLLGYVFAPPWHTRDRDWAVGLPALVVTVSACLVDLGRGADDRSWFGPTETLGDAERSLRRLAVGLAPDDAELLKEAFFNYDYPSEPLLVEGVEQKVPFGSPGPVLGYEVVGYEMSHFHSWLCNQLQIDVAAKLGITLNEHGLLETYEAADAVAKLANGDEDAEPVDWLPIVVCDAGTPNP